MRRFRKSYRLYGPVRVSGTGEIQGATLRGRSQGQREIGILDFYIESDSEQEAKSQVESEYQNRAQHTTNILSYVLEDGIILGDGYDLIPTDRDSHQTSVGDTILTSFSIEIADAIMETASEDLKKDNRLRRALTWYSLGLSTQTPEDRLVAFWTGMESLVENEPALTEEEQVAYDDLTETIDEELSELDDLRESVRAILGNVQNESNKDAVERVLRDEAGYEKEELKNIPALSRDRGRIVHSGTQLSDATEKADAAKSYLRSLLDSRITENIEDIVDFDLPLEVEDIDGSCYEVGDPMTAPEDWLGAVFEHEPGLALTKDKIFKRAYPIFKDIHQVARIETILPKMCGWGRPLRQISDDIAGSEKYEYSPLPDWVTPEVDAIMQYLYQAGELPINVITRNANNARRDVDLSDQETEELCATLVEKAIVDETEDEYYKLSIDGEMCIEGRADPFSY